MGALLFRTADDNGVGAEEGGEDAGADAEIDAAPSIRKRDKCRKRRRRGRHILLE